MYSVRLNLIAGASPTIRSDVTEFSLPHDRFSVPRAFLHATRMREMRGASLFTYTEIHLYRSLLRTPFGLPPPLPVERPSLLNFLVPQSPLTVVGTQRSQNKKAVVLCIGRAAACGLTRQRYLSIQQLPQISFRACFSIMRH